MITGVGLIVVWIVAGIALFVLGQNLHQLWAVWFTAFGVLIAIFVGDQQTRNLKVVCLALTSSIFLCLLIRCLPIYSLSWGNTVTIQISRFQEWKVVIKDPQEVAAFCEFGRRGHYETMWKSGYGYHVYMTDHFQASTGYYIHGNAFGDRPGGMIQSVFVPSKTGFVQYFEALMARTEKMREPVKSAEDLIPR